MKRFFRNRFFWSLLVIVVASGVAFSRFSKKETGLNLGTVARGDLTQRVTISGVVTPNRRTVITAPYNGYVRKMFVQIGSQLGPGDPVVSIAQSLRGGAEDVFPLRSPFAGTVVQVMKTEGEYVEQQASDGGNALVRIDDMSRMFVQATAPEIEIVKLKIGQEAAIKASAVLARSYAGKIQHISLAAKEQRDWDRSRVEFPVQIEVTNKDQQLRPGMSVVADIIVNKLTNVLTLKHEYLQKDGEKYMVVTEKGERKPIEVGMQNEEVFEIKSGLKEGDKIRQTDFLSLIKNR